MPKPYKTKAECLKLIVTFKHDWLRRPYPGLFNVLANGLACHIQISVFLRGSSLNAPVKLEKLRLSRGTFSI